MNTIVIRIFARGLALLLPARVHGYDLQEALVSECFTGTFDRRIDFVNCCVLDSDLCWGGKFTYSYCCRLEESLDLPALAASPQTHEPAVGWTVLMAIELIRRVGGRGHHRG